MGYDIYAKKDKAYFRNNISMWPPLWKYICTICSDVLSAEDMEMGMSSEGYEFDAIKTKIIYERLKEAVENGFIDEYAEAFTLYKSPLEIMFEKCDAGLIYMPRIDYKQNAKNFIEFLENSEGFTIW